MRFVAGFVLGVMFAAALLITLMVASYAQEQCITAEMAIEKMTQQNPRLDVQHVFLGEDQRIKFVRNFNNVEPKTNHEGAQVLVFAATGLPEVVVYIFGNDGCREVADKIPLSVFVQMINVTTGDQEVEGGI